MKKLIILIITISLFSCKAAKVTTDSTSNKELLTSFEQMLYENRTKTENSVLSKLEDFQKSINEIEQKKQDESKSEIEYDTDKPIVPETGKPPVKKETNYNSTTETAKQITSTEIRSIFQQELNELREQIESSYKSKLDSVLKENQTLKSKTETENNGWLYFIIGLSLPCILFLFFKIRKLFRK